MLVLGTTELHCPSKLLTVWEQCTDNQTRTLTAAPAPKSCGLSFHIHQAGCGAQSSALAKVGLAGSPWCPTEGQSTHAAPGSILSQQILLPQDVWESRRLFQAGRQDLCRLRAALKDSKFSPSSCRKLSLGSAPVADNKLTAVQTHLSENPRGK